LQKIMINIKTTQRSNRNNKKKYDTDICPQKKVNLPHPNTRIR